MGIEWILCTILNEFSLSTTRCKVYEAHIRTYTNTVSSKYTESYWDDIDNASMVCVSVNKIYARFLLSRRIIWQIILIALILLFTFHSKRFDENFSKNAYDNLHWQDILSNNCDGFINNLFWKFDLFELQNAFGEGWL